MAWLYDTQLMSISPRRPSCLILCHIFFGVPYADHHPLNLSQNRRGGRVQLATITAPESEYDNSDKGEVRAGKAVLAVADSSSKLVAAYSGILF